MYSIGIDIGSVSTKGVLYDGKAWEAIVLPTGWMPKEVGELVLDKLCSQKGIDRSQIDKIIGTGYGRIHLPFAHKIVSEIACHGRGARYLFPQAIGVIDVGGQDSKAMLIDEVGRVMDFVLNDKCAAGTGRFLQVATQALGVGLEEVDALAKEAKALEIGSMCTVFAETEVLNLLMQGEEKADIVAGLLKSIANKVVPLARKIIPGGEVVFTGGLAKSKILKDMITYVSGWDIKTTSEPQIIGALGAAVIGYELTKREMKISES